MGARARACARVRGPGLRQRVGGRVPARRAAARDCRVRARRGRPGLCAGARRRAAVQDRPSCLRPRECPGRQRRSQVTRRLRVRRRRRRAVLTSTTASSSARTAHRSTSAPIPPTLRPRIRQPSRARLRAASSSPARPSSARVAVHRRRNRRGATRSRSERALFVPSTELTPPGTFELGGGHGPGRDFCERRSLAGEGLSSSPPPTPRPTRRLPLRPASSGAGETWSSPCRPSWSPRPPCPGPPPGRT